jgi:hypothetical protein
MEHDGASAVLPTLIAQVVQTKRKHHVFFCLDLSRSLNVIVARSRSLPPHSSPYEVTPTVGLASDLRRLSFLPSAKDSRNNSATMVRIFKCLWT